MTGLPATPNPRQRGTGLNSRLRGSDEKKSPYIPLYRRGSQDVD
ncbi:MAG TPA: hypothetical protein VMT12_03695 [Syntrophales bacterium]|nr:hypothetical protein [Syntrophales bacterium]